MNRIKTKRGICYLFVAPYMLIFIVFTVLPVVASIFLSFTSFNVLEAPIFKGADNYIRLFLEDEVFLKAFRNTFVLAAVTGPVSYILSLICAWLINDLRPWLRAVMTVIFSSSKSRLITCIRCFTSRFP